MPSAFRDNPPRPFSLEPKLNTSMRLSWNDCCCRPSSSEALLRYSTSNCLAAATSLQQNSGLSIGKENMSGAFSNIMWWVSSCSSEGKKKETLSYFFDYQSRD